MDNAIIELAIMTALREGHVTTKPALAKAFDVEADEVERALERMKRKGKIAYVKATKAWAISSPSALPVDPVVQPSNVAAASAAQGTDTNMENQSTNRIDAAINAAKQRTKKDKPAATATDGTTTKATRPRLSAEDKAKRDADREQDKAARKAKRDEARAAKQAEKAAGRKPAHMSKVDKAAAKLPALSADAQALFNELTVSLPASAISALAAHLTHFNRVKATERALGQKVEAGSKVRIVGGDPRFIGLEGTVSKAQRIRCYVEVANVKRPVYLFTSDVEVIENPAQAANG